MDFRLRPDEESSPLAVTLLVMVPTVLLLYMAFTLGPVMQSMTWLVIISLVGLVPFWLLVADAWIAYSRQRGPVLSPRRAGRRLLRLMISDAGFWDGSPEHPIIDRPDEYELTQFDVHNDPNDRDHSYIDMTFQKGETIRRLRFHNPGCLQIEEGFPGRTGGMIIVDISNRGWQDYTVEVADCESGGGGVSFYAANVVNLDAVEDTTPSATV